MSSKIYRIDICEPTRAPDVKAERLKLEWKLEHESKSPGWSIDIQTWPAAPALPSDPVEHFEQVLLVFSRPAP